LIFFVKIWYIYTEEARLVVGLKGNWTFNSYVAHPGSLVNMRS